MNIKRLFIISGSLLLGLTIILIWLLFGPPVLTRAASFTVCPTGPPTCDYNSVQSAVDAAGAGDVIKVAAGTYTGINNKGGQAQVVYIDKSVTIRGGYTTTNWTTSDPVANPTTLDAQGGGRVLFIVGNISPTIEGLRITGGEADGLGSPIGIDAGGGVFIHTATANIKNNQIFSNAANSSHNGDGAGVYLYQSDATLDGNTINSNTAQRLGGGLYLFGSDATLSNNTISGNNAVVGGGIYLSQSPSTLDSNTVSENYANDGGGGVQVDLSAATLSNNTIISNTGGGPGGIALTESDNAVLTGNTISNNRALGTGVSGGGIYIFRSDNVTLNGNIVYNNSADHGGGLHVRGSGITLVGNIISSNTANGAGGLSVDNGNATLSNNIIFANEAIDGGGGGLDLSNGEFIVNGNTIISNTATHDGGGLIMVESEATFTNNIIADNQAGFTGSGLSVRASSIILFHNTISSNHGGDGSGMNLKTNSTVALTNTIIVGHTVGIYVNSGATASLESTLWGDGAWANNTDWNGTGTINTTNDHWGNPDFIDPNAGDYHIGPDSAAIDQGVDAGVTNDIDHHPRPYQEPDIGADEYWPPGALKFIYLPVITR